MPCQRNAGRARGEALRPGLIGLGSSVETIPGPFRDRTSPRDGKEKEQRIWGGAPAPGRTQEAT